MKHVLILSIAVTEGVCALAATFATHKFRSDTATTEQRSDTAATERQRDGAAFQTAWAELRRLESYTKVGLSFDQYSERVLTAQANIDAALSRVTVKGLVETKFRHAMGDYTKALDVWRRCAEEAAPLQAMRLVDDTGRLIRAPEVRFSSDEIGLESFGYNIENRALMIALEERAAELSDLTRFDDEADTVSPDESTVEVRAGQGKSISARLVVGADGVAVEEFLRRPVLHWVTR